MVNQDILGGLKNAVAKGETLQVAMQTFYNAGYKKEEIYEAARAVQSPSQVQAQSQTPSASSTISPAPTSSKLFGSNSAPAIPPQTLKPISSKAEISSVPITPQSKTPQIVSNYGKEVKSPSGFMGSTGFIILLVVFLLIAIGVLISMLLL